MPPDRRTWRDIYQAWEGMKEYQLLAGQWCHWFRFNKAGTTSHPVYDVGPQRAWFAPVVLPIQLGEYQRAPQNYDDDGLYQTDKLHMIVSYNAFFTTEMPDPDPNGQDHVNDRLVFDGHLFAVDSFYPRGRVADQFLTISIDCVEVGAADLSEDAADFNAFYQYLGVADYVGSNNPNTPRTPYQGYYVIPPDGKLQGS